MTLRSIGTALSGRIPFRYIYTLARSSGSGEARNRLDAMPESCIRPELLPEVIDPGTGEHRDCYPQTCSPMRIEGVAMRMGASPKTKS